MVAIKKLELSIDLTRPAEEITEAIITIMEFYPGRQLLYLAAGGSRDWKYVGCNAAYGRPSTSRTERGNTIERKERGNGSRRSK